MSLEVHLSEMLSFMSGLESDYTLSETLAVCFLRSVKKIFRSSELRRSQFFSMHNSKTSAGRGEWISLLMYQNIQLQEVGTSYLGSNWLWVSFLKKWYSLLETTLSSGWGFKREQQFLFWKTRCFFWRDLDLEKYIFFAFE